MTTTDPGCFFHGEEPIPPNAYRVCGECGHAYATADDVLVSHNRGTDIINEGMSMFDTPIPHETNVDKVPCCPLCSHDW